MKIGGCFEVEIWLFFNFWLPKTASVLAELSWTHSTNSLTNNSSENYRPISSQLPFHNSITSQSNPFVRPFVRSSQQPVLFTAHAGFVRLLRTPVRLFASHAGSLVCSSVRLFVCSSDKFNTTILSSNNQTKLNLQILQITTSFEQSGFLILVLLVFINIVKP
jgi:hypothetical protein